ncbi:MAG TPA: amidase, partial [Xanthomonadaceae bacterium]|nr:amidase [Xanthomonadaceae bacterium]
PMTRSVADAAALMAALAAMEGPSGDPAMTAAAGGETPSTETSNAAALPLAGKRFGLLRQAMGRHPGLDAATERAVEQLRAAGAEVVDVEMATWGQWGEHELTVLLYEFKDGLNRYLAEGNAPVASLEALIGWNAANADRTIPWFGQELFEQAQAKGPLTDAEYLTARDAARRLAGDDGLLKLLHEQRLDAVIAPTTGPAWPIDPVLGDHFVSAGYGAAAVAGTPSLTIPMGDLHGLPIGLSLLGSRNGDARLLALGAAVEGVLSGSRQPPSFRPTLSP